MATTAQRKATYHTTAASERLGISAWSLRRLVREGKVPFRRMHGERTRFYWLDSDLEEIEAAMFCGGCPDAAAK